MIGAGLSTWLALALLAQAEPPAALPEARPSRAAVRLGEPFELVVALRHRPDEAVELEPPASPGPFGVRSTECHVTPGDGGATTACTLELQLFALGDQELPALWLKVKSAGGERRVAVPASRVRALGAIDPAAPAAEQQLREAPAPPVRVRSWRLLAWAGGAAALLAAALLAWRLLRRPARPLPAALSPGQRFSRQVREIAARDLPQRGRGRDHVDLLAGAVRDYLAAVVPQAALDLTTAELREALRARPTSGPEACSPALDAAALDRFLQEADLVKFARHEPDAAGCARALAFARALAEAADRPGAERPAGKDAA